MPISGGLFANFGWIIRQFRMDSLPVSGVLFASFGEGCLGRKLGIGAFNRCHFCRQRRCLGPPKLYFELIIFVKQVRRPRREDNRRLGHCTDNGAYGLGKAIHHSVTERDVNSRGRSVGRSFPRHSMRCLPAPWVRGATPGHGFVADR